jgi:hypothetical protein
MPAPDDRHDISQQLLYPLNDPTTAFQNALRQAGINPNATNPFTRQLQNSAQGARVAFLQNFSETPAYISPTTGNPSAHYGNWLTTLIKSGGLTGQLSNSADRFGQSLDTVRGYERRINEGGDPSSLNPYQSALRDIFASDGGKGAVGAYASLRTPMMGQPLGRAYSAGLDAQADSNLSRFYREGTVRDDPWQWLFSNNARGLL